jgi:hypothetical protein
MNVLKKEYFRKVLIIFFTCCHSAIGRSREPAARENYLERAQGSVWQRYAPQVIAGQFIDLVKEIRHEKKAKRSG